MCSLFLVLTQLQFMPKQEYRLSRKRYKYHCLTNLEVPVNKVRSRLPRSEPFVGRARIRCRWLAQKTSSGSLAGTDGRVAHIALRRQFLLPPPPSLQGWLDASSHFWAEHHHHTLGHVAGQWRFSPRLLSSSVPRVLHRAALPRHPSMPGVRYADARSPSPIRSTGTAVWGVRSIVAA